MNTKQDYIAVFDSGVGGLTVLDAMRRLMPGEDYLFLGDTARVPYGAKSQKTIVRYSLQAAAKLIGQRIKLLVIACNTASAAALPALRETWPDMPIIGVVEPGARAACEASPSGDIAVIATESTVRSGAYAEAIFRRRPDAQVRSLVCPLFVPLAEEGWFDGPIANYASRVNGLTDIAVTKLDVLSAFDTIKVCVAYDVDGERYTSVPEHQVRFEHAKPIYEELPGWKCDITGAAARGSGLCGVYRGSGTHPRDVHWRWRWSRADHQPILEVIGTIWFLRYTPLQPKWAAEGYICLQRARAERAIHP